MTHGVRGYGRLLAKPGIGALFASQLVSLLGSAVYELGVIWLTYDRTRSPALTALVAAANSLPALLSPFLGALSDHFSPKRLQIVVDVARGAVGLTLAVATVLAGFPPIVVIVAVSLLLGIGTRIYVPARYAWLPRVVPDDELGYANALASLVANVRLVLGGALTALVLTLGSPALVFLCDGVSYLLSAVLLLRLPAGGPPTLAGVGRDEPLVRSLARTAVHPALRGIYGLGALSSLALVGAWTVGSPILAARLASGSSLYPLLQAVYGVGVGSGALVVGIVLARPGSDRTVVVTGYLLRVAGLLGLALARTVPLAILAAFTTGLAIPAVTVTLPSLLQRAGRRIGRTGRIFGVFGLANAGVIGLSVLVYGALASALPLTEVFLLAVACALALAALAPALLRPEPQPRAS